MTLKPARLQWSDDGALASLDYNDVYFQRQDGRAEKRYVFLEKNRLPDRFAATAGQNFRIAELGFGSGLNFLETAALWQERAPQDACLSYVAFEKHPIRREDLERVHAFWPDLGGMSRPLIAQYPPMLEGFHHIAFPDLNIRLTLVLGDALETLPTVTGVFDAWYLDGFSPNRNPDMWTPDLIAAIGERTAAGGTLATFSCAGAVRRALSAAGFELHDAKGFGIKWRMTVATKAGTRIHAPRKSVAVLGAGIAGASVARALADRGHDVTVFDKHAEPAQETSGNPIGIVYPKLTMAGSPLGAFYRHGFSVAQAWLKSLPIASWNPCGVLHLDMSDGDETRHRILAEVHGDSSYAAYDGGLWQPCGGYVSPPDFCRTLLNHPRIKTRYGAAIASLDDIKADAAVIALGACSGIFDETAWLPLHPLRGQVTALRPTASSTHLNKVICHEGYVTPVIDGLHHIGATFQKEPLAQAEARAGDDIENVEKLAQALPDLGFTPADIISGRAGYRATTPDKLPMIGHAPVYDATVATGAPVLHDNIYLSTGFGAFGMTGAPLAGETIAAMIAGDPLPVPLSLMEKLSPARFILRDLRRGKVRAPSS